MVYRSLYCSNPYRASPEANGVTILEIAFARRSSGTRLLRGVKGGTPGMNREHLREVLANLNG